MRRLDIEVSYIQVCPYCKTKKIIKKTCGDVPCQYKHHTTNMTNWWKKNGKLYNGKRKVYLWKKSREQYLQNKQNATS